MDIAESFKDAYTPQFSIDYNQLYALAHYEIMVEKYTVYRDRLRQNLTEKQDLMSLVVDEEFYFERILEGKSQLSARIFIWKEKSYNNIRSIFRSGRTYKRAAMDDIMDNKENAQIHDMMRSDIIEQSKSLEEAARDKNMSYKTHNKVNEWIAIMHDIAHLCERHSQAYQNIVNAQEKQYWILYSR